MAVGPIADWTWVDSKLSRGGAAPSVPGMSHDMSHDPAHHHIGFQVDQEIAKLLELKAQLEEGADSAAGKFVLKCPKVGVACS